jgi:hypothetical protein
MDLIHHPRDADLLGRQYLYLSAAVSAWELAVHDGIKRVYHYLAKFSGGGLTNIQVVHLFWQQMRRATPGATLPQAHYKSGHTCLSYGSTLWVQIAGFSAADNTKCAIFTRNPHPAPPRRCRRKIVNFWRPLLLEVLGWSRTRSRQSRAIHNSWRHLPPSVTDLRSSRQRNGW